MSRSIILLAVSVVVLSALPASAAMIIDVQLRIEASAPSSQTLVVLPADFIPDTAGPFYLGVWVKDVSGSPVGLAGGYLDLGYDGSHVTVTGLTNGSTFDTLQSGSYNNTAGSVDDLGGLTFSAGMGDDEWVLLGHLSFTWDGDATTISSAPGDPQFALYGSGENVPWPEVHLDNMTMPVPEPAAGLLLALGGLGMIRRRRK